MGWMAPGLGPVLPATASESGWWGLEIRRTRRTQRQSLRRLDERSSGV